MNAFDPRHPGGGPLVVKLGGSVIEDAARAEPLWSALARLHNAEPSGVVLVHGGGSTVDRRMRQAGLDIVKREGIRVTPDDHIEEVVATLAGVVNKSVVGGLRRSGANAVGLCMGDGGIARAVKADQYSFDAGRVGRIVGGDGALLRTLVFAGYMPVLSSVALDDNGEALNVNADDAACAIAAVVRARALVLLTDVPGVHDANGRVIDVLTPADVETRIASGEIDGGMIPKVRGAVRAAADINAPVVIASAECASTLAALACAEAFGTRVVPDAYAPMQEACV